MFRRSGSFRRWRERVLCARGMRAMAIAGGAWAGGLALSDAAVAGPEGAQVVRGNVSISQRGDHTLIRAGNNSIINYRSFDIASHESVRFLQPSSSARVLNRIDGAAPTRIDGSLTANGRVYLVNPAGVIFGRGSVVNAAGIIAAAGNISDSDFLAQRNLFTDLTGAVENYGIIRADQVHLAGHEVINAGSIFGSDVITMTAGNEVFIGERDGRVMVKVKGDDVSEGGGSTRTDSPTGGVHNSGTLATRQGQVVASAGDMFALAMQPQSLIRGAQVQITGGQGSRATVSGRIDATNTDRRGTGGQVRITAQEVALYDAVVDASGWGGGGTVYVGGGPRGGGDMPTADAVVIGRRSEIHADATMRGDGGTVVVYGERYAAHGGLITARGGREGGNGGFVELSSPGTLIIEGRVVTASPNGRGGTLLIDPTNITIEDGGDNLPGGDDMFLPDLSHATIGAGDLTITEVGLETLVAANDMVILEATNNITIEDITDGEIALPIDGTGSLSLIADFDEDGAGAIIFNDPTDVIRTAGGDIMLQTGAGSTLGGFDAGAGIITLRESSDVGIGLGDVGIGGGLVISGAELQRFTAGELILQTDGPITVDNVTAADSNNLGTITFSPGETITFENAASTFNAATINGGTGLTVNAAVSTDTGSLTLDGNNVVIDLNADISAATSLTIQNTPSLNIGDDVDLTANNGALSANTADNAVTQINFDGAGGTNNIITGLGDALVTLAPIVDTSPDSITINSEGSVTIASVDVDNTLNVNVDTDDDGMETLTATFTMSATAINFAGSASADDTLTLTAAAAADDTVTIASDGTITRDGQAIGTSDFATINLDLSDGTNAVTANAGASAAVGLDLDPDTDGNAVTTGAELTGVIAGAAINLTGTATLTLNADDGAATAVTINNQGLTSDLTTVTIDLGDTDGDDGDSLAINNADLNDVTQTLDATDAMTARLAAAGATTINILRLDTANQSLTITGGTGNDPLTIDLIGAGGNPIPMGGLTFNGGDNNEGDSLIVTGTTGADSVSIDSAGMLVVAGGNVATTTTEFYVFNLGDGADDVTINAGASNAIVLNLDPDGDDNAATTGANVTGVIGTAIDVNGVETVNINGDDGAANALTVTDYGLTSDITTLTADLGDTDGDDGDSLTVNSFDQDNTQTLDAPDAMTTRLMQAGTVTINLLRLDTGNHSLAINGGTGDDALTVDLTGAGGNPVPMGGLSFAGGDAATLDTFTLNGAPAMLTLDFDPDADANAVTTGAQLTVTQTIDLATVEMVNLNGADGAANALTVDNYGLTSDIATLNVDLGDTDGDDGDSLVVNNADQNNTQTLSAAAATTSTLAQAGAATINLLRLDTSNQSLAINGGTGDDALTVDLTGAGGNPVPMGGLSFAGGDAATVDTFTLNGVPAMLTLDLDPDADANAVTTGAQLSVANTIDLATVETVNLNGADGAATALTVDNQGLTSDIATLNVDLGDTDGDDGDSLVVNNADQDNTQSLSSGAATTATLTQAGATTINLLRHNTADQSLTINGGTGDDALTVDLTGAGGTPISMGGLSFDAGADTTDDSLTVTGTGGIDDFIVNADGTLTINTRTITTANVEALTLNLGGGIDAVTFNGTSALFASGVTIDGGGAIDALTADLSAAVTLDLDPDGTTAATLTGVVGGTITFAAVEAVQLNGMDNVAETVTVDNFGVTTPATDITPNIAINLGDTDSNDGDAVVINAIDADSHYTLEASVDGLSTTLARTENGVAGPNLIIQSLDTTSGSITLNGGTGDDELTVDFDNGVPYYAAGTGLFFDGGANGAGGDTLILTGNDVPFESLTYSFVDDSLNFDIGDGVPPITPTNVENFIFDVLVNNWIFEFDTTDDDIFLEDNAVADDGTSRMRLAAPAKQVDFLNPLVSLTINANDGADTPNLNYIDSAAGVAYAGSILVNGGAGSDTLTIDFTAGNGMIPAAGITFTAGDGDMDTMVLADASGVRMFTTITHTFTNATDGTVSVGVGGLITYTGLDPIIDGLAAANRVFTFSDVADAIVIGDDGVDDDGVTRISTTGPTSESVDFVNPTTSLTINAAGGDDTIDLDEIDTNGGAAYGGTIAVNGGAGADTLTIEFMTGTDAVAGGITYDGGADGPDTLVLNDTGGVPVNFTTITHIFTANGDGTIEIDDAVPAGADITYLNLEPINDNLLADNRVFTFMAGGGGHNIIIEDEGVADNGITRIRTADPVTSERVDFLNPTMTLTINAEGGDDVVDVNALDASAGPVPFAADLTINTFGGDDTINLDAVTTGDVTVNAGDDDDTINLGALTANDVTLNGDDDDDVFNIGVAASDALLNNLVLNGAGGDDVFNLGIDVGGEIIETNDIIVNGDADDDRTNINGELVINGLITVNTETVDFNFATLTANGDVTLGDMRPALPLFSNIFRDDAGTVTVTSTTGNVLIRENQSFTVVDGSLTLAAPAGDVSFGDLTARGDIAIVAGNNINLLNRPSALALGFTGAVGLDRVTSIVAGEAISFAFGGGVVVVNPGNPLPEFANPEATGPNVPGMFPFRKFEVPITPAILTLGPTVLRLPVDGPPNDNLADAIAGAIPRSRETDRVLGTIGISPAILTALSELDLNLRDLSTTELIASITGAALYDDMPRTVGAPGAELSVAKDRLSRQMIEQAVAIYRGLFADGGREAIAARLQTAFDAYKAANPDAAFTGEGFVTFCQQSEDHRTLVAVLQRIDQMFDLFALSGLNAVEVNAVRSRILNDIKPQGMTVEQLQAAVDAAGLPSALASQ